MDISLQIKSLLNEAELYRTQGLFQEAKQKYHAASAMIHKIDKLKNKEKLIKAITDKIQSLEEKDEKAKTGPPSPELSEKGQNLIKNLFGENDLQKAIALARFGQFERAVVELEALLKDEAFRVEAGKNIIRCKMATGTIDDAIDQYNQWYSTDLFQTSQMESIRIYLQQIMDKRGLDKKLPTPVAEKNGVHVPAESGGIEFSMPEEEEEEMLDITSIGITFNSGTQKGRMVEFDVNFQSGDMLSLIIPKSDKGMIEDLAEGDSLDDIQFYSPIAMFKGAALIASKTMIDSGPKEGDFCLDLKVTST
jgi:tetratricopeptide (TPR) repeat protein